MRSPPHEGLQEQLQRQGPRIYPSNLGPIGFLQPKVSMQKIGYTVNIIRLSLYYIYDIYYV